MNFLSIFYGGEEEEEEEMVITEEDQATCITCITHPETMVLECNDHGNNTVHETMDTYAPTPTQTITHDPENHDPKNEIMEEDPNPKLQEEGPVLPETKGRRKQTNKKRKKPRNIVHEDDIDELLKLKAPKIEEIRESGNGDTEHGYGTIDNGRNINNNNNTNNNNWNPNLNHRPNPTSTSNPNSKKIPSYQTETYPIPLPMTQRHTPTSSETSPQKQIETFNNLFSIDRKELSGEYFFRGPASAYVCQEDSKKDDQIKKDFFHKIQKRTKINEQYGKYIEEKRALKNTDINDFSNIHYNNEENIWDLSPEVSGSTDLLDKERLIMDALLEGEGHVFKYLKSSRKTLRNKYDIPILPPSYFSDFMRPARGIPFSERPCSRDERCIAYLKQLRITNTNVKDKSWIAREFLLPSDLERIEEDHNFLKTSPRKLCIYCNRNKTEEIYLRMKTKPRSLNMKDMEGKIYYEVDKEDVDEGILVIQDHIVKVSQENITGIDAYPNDSNILQCDPVNGLIGPFKPLIWSEYQTVTVDMVIDTQGTMGKVPALKESQFF